MRTFPKVPPRKSPNRGRTLAAQTNTNIRNNLATEEDTKNDKKTRKVVKRFGSIRRLHTLHYIYFTLLYVTYFALLANKMYLQERSYN